MSLAGRVVLITGAAGAVGRATARRLVADGAKVIAVDRDPGALAATNLGDGDVRRAAFDCADRDAWDRLTIGVDRLDGVVTCAAVLDPDDGDLAALDPAVLRRTLSANLDGVLETSRFAIPLMTRGGSVVHVSSVVAHRGSASMQLAYTASKGAVRAVTRELAVRHAADSIRFNSVAAGLLATELTAGLTTDRAELRRRLAHVPLARLGLPGEIAAACVWLLGDDASYVTATDLVVDGGLCGAFVTGLELEAP